MVHGYVATRYEWSQVPASTISKKST